ncbi:GL13200 [Drosophila persimilis]|uniref:GL13200 n=1 Tax=Drosophila persimilis TaxID=7234 RepID=B4HD03_DROPE|nr:GL13200 [Drosophila persimilis]
MDLTPRVDNWINIGHTRGLSEAERADKCRGPASTALATGKQKYNLRDLKFAARSLKHLIDQNPQKRPKPLESRERRLFEPPSPESTCRHI